MQNGPLDQASSCIKANPVDQTADADDSAAILGLAVPPGRHRALPDAAATAELYAERLPATLVYVGVNVAQVGLFAGARGQQIASRCTTIPTTGFAYGTPEQRTSRGILYVLPAPATGRPPSA